MPFFFTCKDFSLEVIFRVLACTVFVEFPLILGALSCAGTGSHVRSKRGTAANDHVKHVTEVPFPRKKIVCQVLLTELVKEKNETCEKLNM